MPVLHLHLAYKSAVRTRELRTLTVGAVAVAVDVLGPPSSGAACSKVPDFTLIKPRGAGPAHTREVSIA
jgi:hypothetical protein